MNRIGPKQEIKLPVYQLIQNELVDELSLNKFKIGDSFYTEEALISKFKVAKMTIRNALRHLEDHGYIYRRRGAGAFVASLPEKPQRIKIVKHCTFGVIPGKRGFKGHMPLVRILMNLHEQANKKGYLLYLGNDEVTPFIEAKAEGLIVLGELSDKNVELLKKSGIPVVSIGRKYQGVFPSVAADTRKAGYNGYKHLFRCGRRKIVLAGHGRDAETVERAFQPGIIAARTELGMSKRRCHSLVGPDSYDKLKNLLIKSKKIDALMLMNGSAILPALQVINDCGLSIPEDISVLVHGEKALEMNTTPPLSVVRYDYEKAAELAMTMLLELSRGHSVKDAQFRSFITERGSCRDKNK